MPQPMCELESDGHHCPYCGEPHPHYRDGMCELCWHEDRAAAGAIPVEHCPYTEAEIEASQRRIEALFTSAGIPLEG